MVNEPSSAASLSRCFKHASSRLILASERIVCLFVRALLPCLFILFYVSPCDVWEKERTKEGSEAPTAQYVPLVRAFVLRVFVQVNFCPRGKGHPLSLGFVEVFSHSVSMLILCPFYAGTLERVSRWPHAPYAFPVLEAHVVRTGPFSRRRLVLSFVEMFFYAVLVHGYASFLVAVDCCRCVLCLTHFRKMFLQCFILCGPLLGGAVDA